MKLTRRRVRRYQIEHDMGPIPVGPLRPTDPLIHLKRTTYQNPQKFLKAS